MKKLKITIAIVLIIMLGIIVYLSSEINNTELKTVQSESQLNSIYSREESPFRNIAIKIITTPFSFFTHGFYSYNGILSKNKYYTSDFSPNSLAVNEEADSISRFDSASSNKKDYSTTNIQVENVDEADITKTDGNYIYSISNDNVIITNAINPNEVKIEATIPSTDGSMPEDLMLYKDKLVVISSNNNSNFNTYYSKYRNQNTKVKIYNISTKSNPILVKSFELYEPYYTSRCINNQLYVISSGYLRKENDKVIHSYKEDNTEIEIPLEKIKYLKDINTDVQTLISSINLDIVNSRVNLDSYLMDISNAYVSENNIYLINQEYHYGNDAPPISSIFGPKGIIGAFTYNTDESYYGYKSDIYKFNISKDGQVTYSTKNTIEGKTINQYSLDEQNGHLRIALYDSSKGARVAIFDENLKLIGTSNYVAKGETMYSSRFMGNKVYLVTYRTMDPLFVIDLSNESNPKVLGELHIPGYSTYLHPYDETHLIGIGMETKEVKNKNSSGRVISTTAKIVGMKMALFDVSNVNNPIQLSQTVIGDSRTTSAILNNPKALLFSKEKQLIAIPVNNYADDFEVESKGDKYSDIIEQYTSYAKKYVAEGYFVYNINLTEGFKLKGVITHDATNNTSQYNYYYRTKLLRGLYIDNNLFTISESTIKVNKLDTLELIKELKINDREED